MRLYHASLNMWVRRKYNELFPGKKLNVLRSFGMLDSETYAFCVTHRNKIGSLILDSGTWTLNNASPEASKHITLNNYKDYVHTTGKYFDFYFNFDSNFTDDGFEDNLSNQRTLEKTGLSPIPVVHQIEGEEIGYYLSKGYPRIALGSAQIKKVDTLAKVMDKFEGTGTKIHLFGNTKFDFLSNFPIHSCDSAMWARTGGYGYIKYWNPKKAGINKTDKIYMEEYLQAGDEKKITYSNYEFRNDLDMFLNKTLKITYQDLMGLDGAHYKMLVNTYYYVQLEEIVNQIHRLKGFNTFE